MPSFDWLYGKRVLITGIAGCVGANLARAALTAGSDVHGFVRRSSDLWRIASVRSDLRLHVVDLEHEASVRTSVQDARPDIVFHCAVERSSDPLKMVRSNVNGTAHLLEAMRRFEHSPFIHLGSSQEYGPQDVPLVETMSLQPATDYAASKACSTLLSQQVARSQQRPIVVLRLFHVYGPWESPKRLVPTAIDAARRGVPLRLTPHGYRRDYIHVDDVARACFMAAQSEGTAGVAINIGSGTDTTNEDLVSLVEKVVGRAIDVRPDAYTPHGTDTSSRWVADNRLAARLLRWEPQLTLRDGLELTYSWMQDLDRQRDQLHYHEPAVATSP